MKFEDILLDYSKNIITEDSMRFLMDLARECELEKSIQSLFSGEQINQTEQRAVLHTALRNRSGRPVNFEGKNIMEDVNEVLAKMEAFANRLHEGKMKGFSGKKISHIVNIGIGGSDWGRLWLQKP